MTSNMGTLSLEALNYAHLVPAHVAFSEGGAGVVDVVAALDPAVLPHGVYCGWAQ